MLAVFLLMSSRFGKTDYWFVIGLAGSWFGKTGLVPKWPGDAVGWV
jgi:hypothetical protein